MYFFSHHKQKKGENIIGIHIERVQDTKVTSIIETREIYKQKSFDIYNLFVKVDFICEENASFSAQFQSFKQAYYEQIKEHFTNFIDIRMLRNSDSFEGISRRIYELISQYLILESFFLVFSLYSYFYRLKVFQDQFQQNLNVSKNSQKQFIKNPKCSAAQKLPSQLMILHL